MPMTTAAELLRETRRRHGLTQAQLAARADEPRRDLPNRARPRLPHGRDADDAARPDGRGARPRRAPDRLRPRPHAPAPEPRADRLRADRPRSQLRELRSPQPRGSESRLSSSRSRSSARWSSTRWTSSSLAALRGSPEARRTPATTSTSPMRVTTVLADELRAPRDQSSGDAPPGVGVRRPLTPSMHFGTFNSWFAAAAA
jgi:hypothetical protein